MRDAPTDALIVGGGVIGLCTAWYLRQRGLTVRLLERGRAGSESSWAGGGILAPLRPWDYPDAVWSLVHDSLERYPALAEALCARTGIDPQLLRCGAHLLDAACMPRAGDWHARLRLPFIPSAVAVEEAVVQAVMPWVMQVRNPRLCAGLHRALDADAGARIDEGVTVHGLLVRNGRVEGVECDAGDITAAHTIVAAGAWSATLLPEAPAVFPLRGQMLRLRLHQPLAPSIWLLPEAYVIVRQDGTTLVGSTMERAGFDKSVTAAARVQLMTHAQACLPALRDAEIVDQWAGLRPGVAHGVPTIGPDPRLAGLWWNTGHQRNGLAMAPASGDHLAARIAAVG